MGCGSYADVVQKEMHLYGSLPGPTSVYFLQCCSMVEKATLRPEIAC